MEAARDGTHVDISVCDEGHGVPPEMLAQLFRKHVTLTPGDAGDGIGATGLGLATCKGLVEAHGGGVNLSSHKGPKARKIIEDAGAQLLFLPPYSPDFNPIEMAVAKLKASLRKAAERTVDGLWNAIGQISQTFSPHECKNYFNAAGYSTT